MNVGDSPDPFFQPNDMDHAEQSHQPNPAQLLHNKAVDIKKDNKMDFTPVTGDSYKKLVRSLTHRVRF